jgi:hypothetical protein
MNWTVVGEILACPYQACQGPSIAKRPSDGKYVLWANGVNNTPSYLTTAMNATSNSLTSGWTWNNTAVTVSETFNYGKIYVLNGTAYMVWANTGTGGSAIAPLNPDYLSLGTATDFFIMANQEAGVMFQYGSTYYLITTYYNNFDPSSMAVYYATAPAPTGPWSSRSNLYAVSGNEPAPMYVVYSPVAPTQPILVSTEYVYTNHYQDSYVFAPLIPSGTSLTLGEPVTGYWSPLNYYPRQTFFDGGFLGGRASLAVN